MLIILLLYVLKRCFSDVNVGELEESSRTTLPFPHVSLRRHTVRVLILAGFIF